MKKLNKIFKDLPLEVGKTYTTKFATGEKFKVTLIPEVKIKGIVDPSVQPPTVYGIYENAPHVGVCPLSRDRIIHDKELVTEIFVCHKCGEPIEEHEQHYKAH